MLRASLCFWLGAFVIASGVFCQTYVGIIASGNGSIAVQTYPTSSNKQGEIVGYWEDSGFKIHGFMRSPVSGTIKSFDWPGSDSPGAHSTIVTSINDAGAITGYSISGVAFVRDPAGNVTSFNPPGSISTIALSINAGGAITGYYNGFSFVLHGFVREPNGTVTSFDPPGSTMTRAVAINAKGAIAGWYNDANGAHGYVRLPGGTIVSFDPPESTGTIVTAINNGGAITGSYRVANGHTFGFVRQANGTIVTFDAPGSGTGTGTFPTGINDEGAITGNYSVQRINGNEVHGFVRSPGGMMTSFDPANESTVCSVSPFLGPQGTRIDDNGVITGWCFVGSSSITYGGFVRYP